MFEVKATREAFVTLGDLPPRQLGVDWLVCAAVVSRGQCPQLCGFGQMAIEDTHAINLAEPGAENKGCALLEHAGEIGVFHQVPHEIIGDLPHSGCQLSVFF